MPKFSFSRKESKLFAFLEQDAENLVKMARQLKDMLFVWENIKERNSILADLEKDGDAITHDITRYLYQSFITPLDREDISSLAHSLDDIADRIHSVADKLYLYRIEVPTERARELSELILKAVLEVQGAVLEIKSKINQSEILNRCLAIHNIENSGDVAYRDALVDLFAHSDDMISIVKWREIYEKMESTVDGCEVCANVMEGIAMKYT